MNKGIVMEMSAKRIVVMTPQGRFVKIPRSTITGSCQIGEEIGFSAPLHRFKLSLLPTVSTAVAAVLLFFVMFAGISSIMSHRVVAYVSIDINPSIEIGIDASEKVRRLRGLNGDGWDLIESLDYRGKTLQDVTANVLKNAESKYLSRGTGDIIISSTVVMEDSKVDDAAISNQMKQIVTEHIVNEHPEHVKQYSVAAIEVPAEVRKEANKEGISTGKMAIYLSSKTTEHPIQIEQLREESVEHLADQYGGITGLINPDNPPTKKDLQELYDQMKSRQAVAQADKTVVESAVKQDNKKNQDKQIKDEKVLSKKKDDKNQNDDKNQKDNKNQNRNNQGNKNQGNKNQSSNNNKNQNFYDNLLFDREPNILNYNKLIPSRNRQNLEQAQDKIAEQQKDKKQQQQKDDKQQKNEDRQQQKGDKAQNKNDQQQKDDKAQSKNEQRQKDGKTQSKNDQQQKDDKPQNKNEQRQKDDKPQNKNEQQQKDDKQNKVDKRQNKGDLENQKDGRQQKEEQQRKKKNNQQQSHSASNEGFFDRVHNMFDHIFQGQDRG